MIFLLTYFTLIILSLSANEVRSKRPVKQLPQAIIIGVKKSGTRALLKFLSTHPSIAGSSREIHFFDRTEHFHRGLDWYREQMPVSTNRQTLTIEKTPHYFVDRQTPRRLANVFPQMKLILILRDPIIRAISDYVQLKNHPHPSYPTFDQIIAEKNFSRWTPIRIGCYAHYLQRWLRYFPREQIHLVDGENLIRRPWEELEHVQRFLNISIELQREHFYFNPSKYGFPCLRQPDGCLGSAKGRPHPTINLTSEIKLKAFYRKCNARLKTLAHIDFPWIE